MRWVSIPFDMHFQDMVRMGIKTCTSRYHRYGEAGCRFEVFGGVFVLDSIEQVYLWRVAQYAHRAEGFTNPEAFIDFWKRKHSHRGFQPNDMVFLHKFHRETRT